MTKMLKAVETITYNLSMSASISPKVYFHGHGTHGNVHYYNRNSLFFLMNVFIAPEVPHL